MCPACAEGCHVEAKQNRLVSLGCWYEVAAEIRFDSPLLGTVRTPCVPWHLQPPSCSPNLCQPVPQSLDQSHGQIQTTTGQSCRFMLRPFLLLAHSRGVWGITEWNHRITKSFRLEKTLEIIQSNCKPNSAKSTTKPKCHPDMSCKMKSPCLVFAIIAGTQTVPCPLHALRHGLQQGHMPKRG